MLRSFRENIKGRMGKVLLAVIIVPFVFFGAESLLSGRGGIPAVLEVNGDEINELQLSQNVVLLRNELASRMGENVDFEQLSDERLVPIATERLLQRTLIDQFSQELNMSVPEQMLQQTIVNTPSFQVDGKFSSEHMNRVLADSGFNLTLVKERLSDDIRLSHISTGLGASAFASQNDVALLLNIMNEARSIEYAELNYDDFADKVSVGDSDLNEYYENHLEQFTTPVSVDSEYLLLSLDALIEPVSEEALLAEYEVQKAQYENAERRRVAHILFEISDELDQDKAIARAEDIRQQFEAGENFSELAVNYSQDGGSASEGGDLGFTEQDGSFPEAFEQAVFALEKDQISEPVVTDAGVHLIKVTDIEQTEILPYDELKQTLATQIQRQAAGKKYVEWSSQLADLTFNAENLSDPAEELGIPVNSVKGVTEEGLVDNDDPDKIFSNPRVLEELFSTEVMDEQLNSNVIELGSEKSVVVRVDKVHQPRVEALSEVEDSVRQIVTKSKVRAYVSQLVEEIQSQLESGATFGQVLAAKDLTVKKEEGLTRQTSSIEPFMIEKVFAASRNNLGKDMHMAESESSSKSYLFQLTEIRAADEQPNEALTDLFSRQARSLYGRQDTQAFLDSLKRAAKIERF